MKKQTSSNNELLRAVKRIMNKIIYKSASTIVNERGEEAALTYLQQFFNQPVSKEFFETLANKLFPSNK